MKVVHYGIWLFLLCVFQPTLLKAISIFGIHPNAFLVFIVLVGFLRGRREGAVCGLIFGFVYDLLIGRLIGLNAILFMYTGFLAGLLGENYFRESNVLVIMGTVVLATVLTGSVYYLAYLMIWGDIQLGYTMIRTILPECAYNAALTCVLFFCARKTMRLFRLSTH